MHSAPNADAKATLQPTIIIVDHLYNNKVSLQQIYNNIKHTSLSYTLVITSTY
jgi:hypothetical protein